ncbi:MAG TPA: ATPase, T2SS/T4P/T4SS family [Candidatus Omnitrophota bacterium]|jgi:type IV pilus assembly protein PilB|nr:ATPase, T2SS/T4P/T4SS family [Candidatus Omnitrophota bacterium]HPN56313.1 ATPase, T2SS/T4P/T4SS family [Candidatus Omnitrophota bacterium]
MINIRKSKKIGEAFKAAGLISAENLDAALEEQRNTSDRLGDILLRLGLVTSRQMAPVVADYFRIPFYQLKSTMHNIPPEVIQVVSQETARQYKIIPVGRDGNTLIVATSDPLNLEAIDALHRKTRFKIQCVVAVEEEILEAIDTCYNGAISMSDHIEKFVTHELDSTVCEDDETSTLIKDANNQPIIQYVQSLVIQAVSARASDVLLQPNQDGVDLRFRVDGILYPSAPPPKSMLPAISSRIKILSRLDISERRMPQDGRFKIRLGSRDIDIRTSCFPTIYGESIVLRILDTSQPLRGLSKLGFHHKDLRKYRQLLKRPYGLILVTGPTGSGKTTTLYASLNEISSKEKNIITLEDPVEYRLPFIQQSQVNSAIKFDFARGLRSILRQDPDVIMIGEIRDRETAEVAIHAALTGHLVFSTLHTNDSVGAAIRLINMGVEPFLITSSLIGVIGQRLIRRVCPACRERIPADQKMWQALGGQEEVEELYRGRGCPQCAGRGYHGRIGVFELFVPDEPAQQMILQKQFSPAIRKAARDNGMRTMKQMALKKAAAGLTTVEEVLNFTHDVGEE